MRTLTTLDEITAAVGDELGSGEWLRVEQERVGTFADATDDHQWIHVDIERADAGPFGGPIAHGFLTLSLIPFLGSSAFAIETTGARLNYGLNKVRFPNPVKVGQRVRDTVTLLAADRVAAGVQVSLKHVIEIEGETKPACVAEMLVLVLDG